MSNNKTSAKNYAPKSYVRQADPLTLGIDAFDRWNNEAQHILVGMSIQDGLRPHLASACFQLGMEHSVGIVILLGKNMVASARALFRSQFEAFVRGSWFFHCATDVQLENFVNDVRSAVPDFTSLTAALDKKLPGSKLGKFREASWKTLNDYTHGGAIQTGQRMMTEVTQSNYDIADAVSQLEITALLACLTASSMALAMGHEDLALVVEKRFDEIFPRGG